MPEIKIRNGMMFVPPRPDVNYEIVKVTPNPGVDYRIQIIGPKLRRSLVELNRRQEETPPTNAIRK
jgi:hypothetical protein